MRASDQIIELLDGPKREDRYCRTALDDVRLGEATIDQLQHYLACRRVLEQHLDQESVFDELVRLRAQCDDETNDAFGRPVANAEFAKRRAHVLAAESTVDVNKDRLARIAYGMLRDGWPESQVVYALGTLGAVA